MAIVDFNDQIESRDGTLTRDARNVNAFAEATPEGMAMVKRPGLTLTQTLPAGLGQGLFTCSTTQWGIVGATAYNLASLATVVIAGAGSTSVFDHIDNYTSGHSLLRNAAGLWVFDGATATKVADVDYPAATLPGLCELDGTYYVMDAATGRIQGSVVADPTSWDALNFIGAGAAMGAGVAVHRHLNYILGFYTNGLQVFYDNANATGSPLSPAGNASWLTGCADGASVVELNDQCFFLGQIAAQGQTASAQKGRCVGMLTGLELNIISTPFVERILNRADLTGLRAIGVRIEGHPFYALSLPAAGTTLVYDALMKRWDTWSSSVGGSDTAFVGTNALNAGGKILLQDAANGVVYSFDPLATTDAGTTLTVRLRCRNQQWGTMKRKFFGEGLLHADTVTSTLTESHSDDDFATWSTPRSISLATDKKVLQRNGSSRKRAFELVHADATPLRVWGLEFEVERGTD